MSDIESTTNPLVSVIVPVYNQEKFIEATLDSICGQTYKNIEIILIDDGSSDGTVGILHRYAAADGRIILLQQDRMYAGAARNKGLDIAKGEYYSFLDSDDIFEKDMIALLVQKARQNNAEVVLCKADSFDERNNVIPMPQQLRLDCLRGVDLECFSVYKDMPHMSFQFGIGWAWDKLFSAEYVRKNNFRFGLTRHTNDSPFAFPATIMADRICVLQSEAPLIHYRRSTTQLSHPGQMKKSPMSFFESAELIHSKLTELAAPDEVMGSFYIWMADYINFTLRRVFGPCRNEMVNHILSKFEPEVKLGQKLRSLYDLEKFTQILELYKAQLKLYLAMTDRELEVEFSQNSAFIRIKQKKNWMLKFLYHKEKDIDDASITQIRVFGMNFKKIKKH